MLWNCHFFNESGWIFTGFWWRGTLHTCPPAQRYTQSIHASHENMLSLAKFSTWLTRQTIRLIIFMLLINHNHFHCSTFTDDNSCQLKRCSSVLESTYKGFSFFTSHSPHECVAKIITQLSNEHKNTPQAQILR